MTEQEMGYHEAMAALPAYTGGLLDSETQAAVDDYLQRQIKLFRWLDELEEAAGRASDEHPDQFDAYAPPMDTDRAGAHSAVEVDAFTQVMEGQADTRLLPDNPLLMRKAPQAYVDDHTGQRYVIPRRGTLDPDGRRAHPQASRSSSVEVRRLFWGLAAIVAVVAVLMIALYQRNLQQELSRTQIGFDGIRAQMNIISTANRALSLRATNSTLSSSTSNRAIQGTLLIRDQQAIISINGLKTLPGTQVYQVWLRTRIGNQIAVAQFVAQDDVQTRWFAIDLPVDGADIAAVGVNIEPAGDSTQPTTPMIVESQP